MSNFSRRDSLGMFLKAVIYIASATAYVFDCECVRFTHTCIHRQKSFQRQTNLLLMPFPIRHRLVYRRSKSLSKRFPRRSSRKVLAVGDFSANMPRDGYSLAKDIMPQSGSPSFTKTKMISSLDTLCIKTASPNGELVKFLYPYEANLALCANI